MPSLHSAAAGLVGADDGSWLWWMVIAISSDNLAKLTWLSMHA